MLYVPLFGKIKLVYSNLGTLPSSTVGGLVTSGASADTESATPLVLATSAQTTEDIYWIELLVHATTGTGARNILMDFGFDPAGGTSYTWVVNNLITGGAGTLVTGPTRYSFPFYIPAGSQIAVRTQCNQASITQRVVANFYGSASRQETFPRAAYSVTVGTPSGSNGQSFTPGTNNYGSYTDLGSLSRDCWYWQICYGINNGTITAEYVFAELSWGDASNKIPITTEMHVGNTSELILRHGFGTVGISSWHRVPAGANLYVRGSCNGAPDTGYNALAIGFGG